MLARSLGLLCVTLVLVAATLAGAADTRLVEAAKKADTAAVRALVDEGVDVNSPEGDGATALHWAVHLDDADTVDLLIGAGATVNVTNDLGVTPLWLACLNGSAPMVERLLRAGADPNVALPSGETPLMTASRTGNREAVESLVGAGADVNARERARGQTALMWAVAQRHPAVVEALVELGADVHARSDARHRVVNAETSGFDDKGVTEADLGGYTPILFAARHGELDSARLLLAAGADVNDVAPEGTSALVVAAHGGHGALATFLLENGANPNAAGAGYTALHAAILRGDAALVKALLAHGADPTAPLEKGTPARRASPDYVLDYRLVGSTPFWLAARFAEPAIMRTLAAHGADPLSVLPDGTTAVMAATQATRRTEPGFAADPVEDERAILDAVAVALELGVDVQAANENGDTALHLAASRRLDTIVEFLAGKGASLEAKNKKDQTPLALVTAGANGGTTPNTTADLLRKLGTKE